MRYVLDSVWNAQSGIKSLGAMEIATLDYPSSVPANTSFSIDYTAMNSSETVQNAFGYIQNLGTGAQIPGSYWEATVQPGGSYPVSTEFPSGITTTLNGEVRIGHITEDYLRLDISMNPVGAGTVSLNPAGPYLPGTIVQLTANPNAGYQFTGWSGDASGSTNPVNITMNTNKTVVANFQQSSYYTLTASINPPVGGTVTLNPSGGSYIQGTVVQLTATANTGYQFDGWSGAVSGTNNPTSVTVNSNIAVTANFLSIKPCSDYTNPSDCINNGCYWWLSDNKCHNEPEPSPCSTYNGLPSECAQAGCYYNWETNLCLSEPGGQDYMKWLIPALALGIVAVGIVVFKK